ncbi:MAG: hypothetical protein WD431_16415 [Cyclobacteriaceae bacterium]
MLLSKRNILILVFILIVYQDGLNLEPEPSSPQSIHDPCNSGISEVNIGAKLSPWVKLLNMPHTKIFLD